MCSPDLRIGPFNTYQRVNTATDYDSNPALFPWYLRYDGIDDHMLLPYMGLYAAGCASCIVAARVRDSAAEMSVLAERDTGSVSSIYKLLAVDTSRRANGQIRLSDGVTFLNALESYSDPIAAEAPAILSMVDTGAAMTPYLNGTVGVTKGYTRGGSNTVNNTAVGAYVTTLTSGYMSLNVSGSIIVKGAALTAKQRKICERYLANRIGATLQ